MTFARYAFAAFSDCIRSRSYSRSSPKKTIRSGASTGKWNQRSTQLYSRGCPVLQLMEPVHIEGEVASSAAPIRASYVATQRSQESSNRVGLLQGHYGPKVASLRLDPRRLSDSRELGDFARDVSRDLLRSTRANRQPLSAESLLHVFPR
jgi:hypothetical protein